MTETPLPAPSQIIAFLDEAAFELDKLGKELEAAHIDLGDAESEYEEKKEIALLEVVDQYEKRQAAGEEVRLPGEDVRLAMAHRLMDFSVIVRYRKAKHRVSGIRGHVTRLEKAVNARQSTLRALREGMTLEGYGKAPEPQWRNT